MILDDYDMVTVVSEAQERNAYAAAAWRLQYERRARCPDVRDDELRERGERLVRRMATAREYVERMKRARRAVERALQLELQRSLCPVIPFPGRRARRR